MIDYLLQAILSNLIVASLLAIFAWQIQRWTRSATLANLLWALVLIKIVTPPLFSVPLLEVPSITSNAAVLLDAPLETHSKIAPISSATPATSDQSTTENASRSASYPMAQAMTPWFSQLIFPLWLGISLILLVVSVTRIVRFHLLLIQNSQIDTSLTAMSVAVANDFQLFRRPEILVTSANIAPFVWWVSGRSVVVISQRAKNKLTKRDLRLVIAHEIAHIKRRDHLFRWLEWLCVMLFWWNPVMWWARVQLRRSEEMACDDLVLQTATTEVHLYANSLINMAEILASPTVRPPVLASAINSGGILEKRLKMMINTNNWKIPTALRLTVILIAIFIFPLGVVYANQDLDAVERRLGGAVEAGEISLEQANVMLEALRRFDMKREADSKRRRDYTQLERDTRAAAKAEKLSKQEADRRLVEEHARLRPTPLDRSKREIDEKRRLQKLTEEIKAAVESGDITPNEAKKKLEGLHFEAYRRSQDKDRSVSQMEQRRRRYNQLASDLETAVKAGELSKAEAELKVVEMRKKMFNEFGDTVMADKLADQKHRYMKLAEELKAAADSGNMTMEEVEKKLIEVRQKMFGDQKRKQDRDDARKHELRQVVRDIEAALAAGDLTEAEAKMKLAEIQQKMLDKNDREHSRRAKERDFSRIQSAIKEAVESGELSKLDAKQKLLDLKKEMGKRKDRER